jgi:hypothetical protein
MKTLFVGIFLILLLGIAAVLLGISKPLDKAIHSYEECIAAGYPVLESYPPQCKTRSGQSFTQNIGNEIELLDEIRLNSPRPGEMLKSPLVITGEARGSWFFEASFPLRLLDANGTTVAEHYATASEDWMTENFVPFSSTLLFATPETATGTLVLMRDNPSGLPSGDRALRIPVKFDLTEPTMAVKVYFGIENTMDAFGEGDCSAVEPIKRIVKKTDAPARAALMELLAGVTTEEKEQGYYSSLPEGNIAIQKLSIEDGTAFVDFSEGLETGVAGSCRVLHIRSQIEATLKQFETVKEVVISINGRTEDILQP